MHRCPELMNSALLMHNAAVRKCKWVNYGFTVEQEGDSYSLVFYVGPDRSIYTHSTSVNGKQSCDLDCVCALREPGVDVACCKWGGASVRPQ